MQCVLYFKLNQQENYQVKTILNRIAQRQMLGQRVIDDKCWVLCSLTHFVVNSYSTMPAGDTCLELSLKNCLRVEKEALNEPDFLSFMF